ncbi:hypothetical protein HS048_09025 [Planomonospora sp. ID91781]|nr:MULTISPECIES: hypothetical protein [Planomonospora]MBG0820873.1 hypothetical protein [Planomonospora sp. ID91781]
MTVRRAAGAILLALATVGAAHAAGGTAARAAAGDPPSGGVTQDGKRAGVWLKNSRIVISGNGAGAGKGDGYRLKRPCWYEPSLDGLDMLAQQQRGKAWWTRDRENAKAQQKFVEQFKEKAGEKGRWWLPAHNEGDPAGLACAQGLDSYVWVPEGSPPPPGGITMAELADIARAALTVPEPRIRLNPDVRSYVNLPTWVWLDGAGATTRSVTATLPGVMSATVTATLDDIEIDPGTTADRAEVRKDCGARGRPYARGQEFTCGVRYLRASVDQPRGVYELTVTSVWEVTAQGQDQSGVAPFAFDPYDPVQVGATRDVPVGEVQSVVRGD